MFNVEIDHGMYRDQFTWFGYRGDFHVAGPSFHATREEAEEAAAQWLASKFPDLPDPDSDLR